MKCEIEVSWQSGTDTMRVERDREPEEVWGPGGPRNITQAIEVLDKTYADIRAALLVMLPDHISENVPIMVKMTTAEARSFLAEGQL
jgi:hypothetical protein